MNKSFLVNVRGEIEDDFVPYALFHFMDDAREYVKYLIKNDKYVQGVEIKTVDFDIEVQFRQ